jgi:hypothetical protein
VLARNALPDEVDCLQHETSLVYRSAVSAIGGGVALATGLEQKRFPLSLLDGTP